ncbi:VOC family protein [Streptomyces ipomoeae]|uniref:Glyoxalase family protein n=2 Tax=Streptomyces ipomoeae TaxID=103232 RepID=L1KQR6_9ACTN|nr:VOC family protein [Streptomyces ipomoeae]EKX62723.1 glyoxalase family protein [Streptomyces ipomoeae 91-03]MDX2692445.1 VOC family protein [Streptomyces ipomoeae]MDX2823597.1 VOC family protein [Streptomyces ipomoeae]MDX2843286.1 VOC family protein [Streptomyces ipomoeae]MDX2877547.1 VOC family protein [Streptomyces ipomoeae]
MTDNTARLDHVVLWVREPVAAADFYEKAVGLEPVRITEYAAGQVPFPSVRLNDETILDLMPLTMAERMKMVPGAADSAGHPVNHVCIALPTDAFDELRARLEERAVPVSDFSYDSFGARGMARRSFYFKDPDGNVFEARHYE